MLNYIPVSEAVPARATVAPEPANDVASHPPGCTCAVHLAYRKKAARAG